MTMTFFFNRPGSSLLHTGFLQLQRVEATHCVAQPSHCDGFSRHGTQALGTWLSSCGTQA